MTTPSIRATLSDYNTGSRASLSVTKPDGTVEGDIILCFIFKTTGANPLNIPSGFVLLGSLGVHSVYYKVAGPSEPASYTFTSASNFTASIVLTSVMDANPAFPIVIAFATGTSASPSFSSITVPVQSLLVANIAYRSTTAAFTHPPGYTHSVLRTTTDHRTVVSSKPFPSGGATGVATGSLTASAAWQTVHVGVCGAGPLQGVYHYRRRRV